MWRRMGSISLPELISAGIDLTTRAGAVIRDVARSGELFLVDKSLRGAASSPRLAEDPQTIADRRSQNLIVQSLRAAWPNLAVVGEEEGKLAQEGDPPLLVTPARTHPSVNPAAFPSEYLNVPISDVCVWIDPLDATREFTLGILEVVTVLFGITIREQAVAGVIHQPFLENPDHKGKEKDDPDRYGVTSWGCVGVGVHSKFPKSYPLRPSQDHLVLTVTASHSSPALETSLKLLHPNEIVRVAGSGNKCLLVAAGGADAYYSPEKGTWRWDTAAGEGILRALGGGVVDREGKPYRYVSGAPRAEWSNARGLIAYRDPAILDLILKGTLTTTTATQPSTL